MKRTSLPTFPEKSFYQPRLSTTASRPFTRSNCNVRGIAASPVRWLNGQLLWQVWQPFGARSTGMIVGGDWVQKRIDG